MSRSKLSCTLLALTAATPVLTLEASAGSRSGIGAVASLVVFELRSAVLPQLAASQRKVVAVNGSVTTATRTLDLHALKADDFGDETPPASR